MNEGFAAFDALRESLGGGSLAEILEHLVALTTAARSAPLCPPRVTVLLAGGRELTGCPMVLSAREPRLLTLAVPEDRLAFVALGAVVGLVVEEAGSVGGVLPGTEVAGRLDLARRARALGERHGLACTVEVGEDLRARLVVQNLLEALEEAFPTLVEDDAGREAVAGKVHALVLSAGGDLRLEEGRLIVSARGPDRVPDPARLREELEALL